MADFIKFVLVDLHDGRKTLVWAVLTADGRECLGRVGWYSPWRKYCFVTRSVAVEREDGTKYAPTPQIILDAGCMRLIADFCELQTTAHRSKGKAIDHIDGDPSNNSIENLRIVTIKENRK